MFEFFRRQLQTILWYIHGVFTNQLSTEELLRPTVVIAPHQDDEVLGCGGHYQSLTAMRSTSHHHLFMQWRLLSQ